MSGLEQYLQTQINELKAEIAEYERTVAHMRDDARLQNSATAAVMERAEKAEAEVQEQCRLLAMGSEREARLMARVAELERDALRYRWLRDQNTGPSQIWTLVSDEAQPPYMDLKHGNELDSAIDAAMRGDGMNNAPKVKLCRECKHCMPEPKSEWNLRCMHPQVNSRDPWALAKAQPRGSSARDQREKRAWTAPCGRTGKLWEQK